MKKEPEFREVKVGKTNIPLKDLVRDPSGIENVIKEALTEPRLGWAERRLQQIDVKLHFSPSARELEEWDKILLDRYPPVYHPTTDDCNMCPLGPCNLLNANAKGACGMDMKTKMAHESLTKSCKGTSIQISGARDLIKEALKRFDMAKEISHGENVRYPSINPCVLVGFDIYTIADADRALLYAEQQIAELLASATYGNESDVIDLEEKAFHAGSLFLLAAEIAELIKEACFGLCSASSKNLVDLPNFPHFVDQGAGTVDTTKPVIMFAGSSVVPGVETVELLKSKDLIEKIEVAGVGAAGIDIGRYFEGTKNVGSATDILKIIRLGLPDVLVAGEQCIPLNILAECKNAQIPVIATSNKACMGLDDRTDDEVESIVSDIVDKKIPGALVIDSEKAAAAAVQIAQKISGTKDVSLPDIEKAAQACVGCGTCSATCPNELMITEAMGSAKQGNTAALSEVYDSCIYCGKCESTCPGSIPILSLIIKSAQEKIDTEKYKMRAGRGTPSELEFRDVAFAFGFGTVSGIVAFAGCGANPGSKDDVGYMANKLIELNYLVLSGGCAAIDMASYYNDFKQKHLYEAWNSLFQIEGIVNCGSCSALSHIARGFYKYTHVIARTPMRANYTEQADYIYGKLPCAIIMWGPVSEQMYAAACGFARMGVTVVMGPHGAKFNRSLMGNANDRSKWWCYEGFTGKKNEVEPCPPHLIVSVETKEEALVMVTRLLFRTNDFRDGRISKFDSYLTMYEDYFKGLPEDFNKFVRSDAEIPWTKKHKLMRILKEKYGWETENGQLIRAKHPDGRMLSPEEYAAEYGIRVGQYSTFVPRLILKADERAKQEEE